MTSQNIYDIIFVTNTVNTDNAVNTDKIMNNSKQSVYLQIVTDIKRKVELGLLKENDRLPSCREAAIKMGINPNTVQRAYATLEADGYIYTIPKKGVYVCSVNSADSIEKAVREKIAELKGAGISIELIKRIIEEVYGVKL